jgi:hypothetical protein
MVREWRPDEWTISNPIEIPIQPAISSEEFFNIICSKFPHIPIESLEIYKVLSPINVYFDDFQRFSVKLSFYII